MQADHFNDKEGLIEYNVNCFKETLAEVFRPLPRRRKVDTLTGSFWKLLRALVVKFPANPRAIVYPSAGVFCVYYSLSPALSGWVHFMGQLHPLLLLSTASAQLTCRYIFFGLRFALDTGRAPLSFRRVRGSGRPSVT